MTVENPYLPPSFGAVHSSIERRKNANAAPAPVDEAVAEDEPAAKAARKPANKAARKPANKARG